MPTARAADEVARRRREALARNVQRLRQALGLTQEDLAHRAGFDRKSVNRIENAAYSPSADRLFLLADALGVAPADLFEGVS